MNISDNASLIDCINKHNLDLLNIDSQAVCLKTNCFNYDIGLVILDATTVRDDDLIELKTYLKPTTPFVVIADDHVHIATMKALAQSNFSYTLIERHNQPHLDAFIERYVASSKHATSSLDHIIGKSPAISEAKTLASKASQSDITVHLEGDSGVGKELFAKAIHASSQRHNLPFVPINCGAIPENLVESVLFGHEKGAFTGAYKNNTGKFLEADKGTIFLDEIGELKPEIQVKLLRVLQESEVEPVGSKETHKIDVRIISATNKNLEQEVKQGNFREDLFYRLNVFPVRIPALKERKDDIEHISRHYCRRYAWKEGKPIHDLTPQALQLLSQYHWPGNIRELKNLLHRSIIMSNSSDMLTDHDIKTLLNQKLFNPDSSYQATPNGLENKSASCRTMIEYIDNQGEFISLESIEHNLIKAAIEHYGGNMSRAAEKLQIGRSTLYRKLSNQNSSLN
ncbi:MAG: sigma-54 dependent transcriptional regulator [Rickettsiales bacterium]|nr:sigma-54 dependent transcriptional regulator [Rickettsiales bacterium]